MSRLGVDFAALRGEIAPAVNPLEQLDFDDIVFGSWAHGEWEQMLSESVAPLPEVLPLGLLMR